MTNSFELSVRVFKCYFFFQFYMHIKCLCYFCICCSVSYSYTLPLSLSIIKSRDVSEDLSDATTEGDQLLNDPDSGVQFIPILRKKDSRSNKALMRRLHGYAPTDRVPAAIQEENMPGGPEKGGDEIDEFEDVDEFG
jgi:hypothetical protein